MRMEEMERKWAYEGQWCAERKRYRRPCKASLHSPRTPASVPPSSTRYYRCYSRSTSLPDS
jgi:hypothetical protein